MADPPDDAEQRRRWTQPPMQGWYDDIDISLLDPGNEDERHILIQAEHRDLQSAIAEGVDEIERDGIVVNPHLHIAMHEVVANQLWAGDPPETWQTAQRLTALGYPRGEVLHMLASAVSDEIWHAQTAGQPYDRDRFLATLAALPQSWESKRATAAPPPPARVMRPKPARAGQRPQPRRHPRRRR